MPPLCHTPCTLHESGQFIPFPSFPRPTGAISSYSKAHSLPDFSQAVGRHQYIKTTLENANHRAVPSKAQDCGILKHKNGK
jgi:hypothetical protein